ncbi:unnamed protein product [Mytilus edulis]|uniref:Uncharacterized protein n=1 Tax=Mytilus edulis TaxID=6550 RepID=A0A8S3RJ08_MYTED|nr:unnamed protein product [Mytilus edulis]
MTETGKIHKTDLIKLWQQKQFVHHIPGDDYKEFIIQVLVHLDVLVLPKRYSGQDETHVDYFLVPCTVKHKMPMSFLDDKSFANRTIALVYHIRQSSIPSALSFKLIGAVSGTWPIKETHQECSSNCPGLDESVLTMSPSEQHLSRLAYQLNIQSCRELIINLGIQLNDWEDIEYSYTRMPLIIKIMALNFWKTKNIVGRPNKSFNNLLDALKAVGDTRHLLCKV